MRKKHIYLMVLLATLSIQAGAVEPGVVKNIESTLKEIFPDLEVSSIRQSEIEGLYEVMEGAELYYVTGDGRYFIHGDLYDLEERRNLTESKQSLARTEMLKGISKSEYIEFSPGEAESIVYVFTDIDCTYCRRLHSHITDINSLGIAVRYLAYPRTGVDTETFHDMESVWCSNNRNEALTKAKLGKKPVKMKCSNPVASQYELGKLMGVRGTPAVFTENGVYLGGYMDPEELAEAIKHAL